MANYTMKILAVCEGGDHITVEVYKDGVAHAKRVVSKSEITDSSLTWHDVLPFLMGKIISSSGATTAAARKTAIESAVITL